MQGPLAAHAGRHSPYSGRHSATGGPRQKGHSPSWGSTVGLVLGAQDHPWAVCPELCKEKQFFIDHLLVRIHSLTEMNLVDWPCAMGV